MSTMAVAPTNKDVNTMKGGEGEAGKGDGASAANSEVRTRMNKIFHKSGNVPFWKK